MKAIAIYEGGITERRQVAVREDGTLFSRGQYRDPCYGYKWSKWTATGEVWGDNLRTNPERSIEQGFATLFLCSETSACINHRKATSRVRLPA
jgi:hypothetical protein